MAKGRLGHCLHMNAENDKKNGKIDHKKGAIDHENAVDKYAGSSCGTHP